MCRDTAPKLLQKEPKMGRIIFALLFAALAACAVLVAKNTEHGRELDEIFEVYSILPPHKGGYALSLYDHDQRATHVVSVEDLGISVDDLKRIGVGSKIPCWHAWERNLLTLFKVRPFLQCRVPPQKR